MADPNVDWETCAADDDCAGVRLPTGQNCWAHAAEADLDVALKRLGEDGRLDARGVPITTELLKRLLAAAPHDRLGRPVLMNARFDMATFRGGAFFKQATFKDRTWFDHSTFEDTASFDGVIFEDLTWFGGAAFNGTALFRNAMFKGMARFVGGSSDEHLLERTHFQGRALFDSATFKDQAWFDHATFEDEASFDHATFKGEAQFDHATFKGEARFGRAIFGGEGAQPPFEGGAKFKEATFRKAALFAGVTFHGDARFDRATFEGGARFETATFERKTWVWSRIEPGQPRLWATLQGTGRFDQATFRSEVEFRGVKFDGGAWFEKAVFERAQHLGPLLVSKSLVLDQAVFHERSQIEVSAAALCARRARFLAGVQLRVRWAQIVLDDADLAAPSILAGVPPFPDLDEGRWAEAMVRLRAPATRGRWMRTIEIAYPGESRIVDESRPRLLSLCRADVTGLTVAGVDLRACRFVRAHHLDQLRIEGCAFATAPEGRRWTARRTIAEEHHLRWRAGHRPLLVGFFSNSALPRMIMVPVTDQDRPEHEANTWYRAFYRPPAWHEVELPTAEEIAGLYRALRKGREDSKDEPGAADFYYGEMEMRRHARRVQMRQERQSDHRSTAIVAAAEHAILWLYWLISGYGLRAWRALAALAVVIGLAGVGLSRVGFHHPHPSQLVSWLYALQTTVSLEGKARQLSGQLTLPGEVLRVGLRLTGPVLLGLAVLSIRGRVKR
jgi:uncharacterized protein YjbI with pentapeptide repeats